MRVLLVPQVGLDDDKKTTYEFDGEKIFVEFDGVTDEIDFTGFPDGEVSEVETNLDFNIVLSAKKEDGILSVELLNIIGTDATYEERFPEWIEVKSNG